MNPLSPKRAPIKRPASNPYEWLSGVRLTDEELAVLRAHVERSLHQDMEERD